MDTPSNSVGACVPTSSANVGHISAQSDTKWVVLLAATLPGQRARHGTRMPPSRKVNFKSRNGPLLSKNREQRKAFCKTCYRYHCVSPHFFRAFFFAGDGSASISLAPLSCGMVSFQASNDFVNRVTTSACSAARFEVSPRS